MSNKIRHIGVIDSINGSCVKVRILQSSACSGCKVASHCNASETKEKIVEVICTDTSRIENGKQVTVVADASVGFLASFYGYLLPLVVMVATLVVVLNVFKSEGLAALAALGILVPYYLALFLFRNRLKGKLNFEIQC